MTAKFKEMAAADLRAWRQRLNLSQGSAAALLETPTGTYVNWETGKSRIPGAAAKLTRFLERGVSP